MDYQKHSIDSTETYKKLSSADMVSKSSVSTVVLLGVAMLLAVVFVFRLAGIFEINKQTKKLNKATTKTSAHLTLEENKTVGELSERNASDIAAENQMKKIDGDDIVTVETDGCEFTRVYYTEKETKEETAGLSLKDRINRFLGLIDFEDD